MSNEKRRNESEPVGRSSDRLVVYLRFALRCDMPAQHHIKEEISIFNRDTFFRGFEVEQTPDQGSGKPVLTCAFRSAKTFLSASAIFSFNVCALLCCTWYCHDINVEIEVG